MFGRWYKQQKGRVIILTEFEFDDLDAFWEYIKAQGVRTANAWTRLDETTKEAIRIVAPEFTRHIDALAKGANAPVRT